MSEVPETRYAKSGDCHVAYQVIGKGPLDVVFITGFVSHIEHAWDDPRWAHFYRRIASFAPPHQFDCNRAVGGPVADITGTTQMTRSRYMTPSSPALASALLVEGKAIE